jgi:hypothetical protein
MHIQCTRVVEGAPKGKPMAEFEAMGLKITDLIF